jgi:SAM-dependent methyltransferase
MISDRLVTLVRCPDCGGVLARGEPFCCAACDRQYAAAGGYLDLRPGVSFAEQTKYLDEALHADARHEHVSPPLLGAGVRQAMLRNMLRPGSGDLVADFGCGSGRMLVWNRASGAHLVGIDVSPHFAAEALSSSDLVLGDLRRLPFPDATFTKAWSLDVFEHLSREALDAVLGEMARVIAPGGQLFVYSHVRRNSRLAAGLRGINALARRLERMGLVDLAQERLRKSDHVNPLEDIPDLEATVARAGFRIARIRYYTPLVGGFVENILMRMAERWMGRRAARRAGVAADRATEARLARTEAKAALARRGPVVWGLQALTSLMRADLALFGGVRSGPFFALLEREARISTDRLRGTRMVADGHGSDQGTRMSTDFHGSDDEARMSTGPADRET